MLFGGYLVFYSNIFTLETIPSDETNLSSFSRQGQLEGGWNTRSITNLVGSLDYLKCNWANHNQNLQQRKWHWKLTDWKFSLRSYLTVGSGTELLFFKGNFKNIEQYQPNRFGKIESCLVIDLRLWDRRYLQKKAFNRSHKAPEKQRCLQCRFTTHSKQHCCCWEMHHQNVQKSTPVLHAVCALFRNRFSGINRDELDKYR